MSQEGDLKWFSFSLFLLSELRKQIGLNNWAVGRQSKQNGYLMPPACLLSAATVTACEADRHSRACSFAGFSDSFCSVKRPALVMRRQDSHCLPALETFSLQLSLCVSGKGGGTGARFSWNNSTHSKSKSANLYSLVAPAWSRIQSSGSRKRPEIQWEGSRPDSL